MINIKADREVKEQAQKIAGELGLPLSGVVNAFLKDFIRNKAISFSVLPRMTTTLEKVLTGIERDIFLKKNISKAYSSKKEIGDYLDSI